MDSIYEVNGSRSVGKPTIKYQLVQSKATFC